MPLEEQNDQLVKYVIHKPRGRFFFHKEIYYRINKFGIIHTGKQSGFSNCSLKGGVENAKNNA